MFDLKPYSAGIDFKRQNLTPKVRIERVKILIMAVNPQHRYANEAERANQDIYVDFELKITL